METSSITYQCHLFVCGNDRGGARKSCADNLGTTLKDAIKQGVADRGWKPSMRVSHSGCLGFCARGPNVAVYPQGMLFSGVTLEDVPAILDAVAAMLPKQEDRP